MAQQWIVFALLSAVFAALVAVFGKIGLKGIDTNLATTIRALVMFLFLLAVIFVQGKHTLLGQLSTSHYAYIILAGVSGALSWLFYFLALRSGDATKVAALDRLSVAFVFIFGLLILGEKFSVKVLVGISMIVAGAILTVI